MHACLVCCMACYVDDDTLAELNNYEVRSLDDFEPYPSYDGGRPLSTLQFSDILLNYMQ